MLFAMVVLIVAIPIHFTGGIGRLFEQVAQPPTRDAARPVARPLQLTSVAHGMLISAIGVGFMTTPHLVARHCWPRASATVLRRNYAFLPMYQIVIILP